MKKLRVIVFISRSNKFSKNVFSLLANYEAIIIEFDALLSEKVPLASNARSLPPCALETADEEVCCNHAMARYERCKRITSQGVAH